MLKQVQRPIDLPDVAGNVRPALLAGVPRAGLVNSVGPLGLPPHAEKTLEPLEHTVLTQTDPAGQFAPVGMLSPSDCYPVGPVGTYVTGGPAGVIGSDIPWLEYPACNALTWVITVTE